jgi:hypothetical protein
MALKADRYELQHDISFYWGGSVADRGGIAVHGATAGSGAAMDQGENIATYQAVGTSNSGIPLGVLLQDVVNKDLTRTHINIYKNEVQVGGKVAILRKGYVVTNMIDNVSVTAGQAAYVSPTTAGNFTNVATSGGAIHKVGRFLTSKDADGYAKIEVNLPN